MTKRKEDDGFAEYCRVFAAAKVDFSMPFIERLARMLAFTATEVLEKELDFGDTKRSEYVLEYPNAKQNNQAVISD